ncbi:MAG: AI-2E family transporter [Paracoccus denitrificans]|nr:MAG: AI-2E family transporter [Paracoccus denitrificans]PZO84946.1 MAG: AI-2E family transporter [Paracoccus denitrificans]
MLVVLNRKTLLWVVGTLITVILLFKLRGVLMPFLLGAAIAYFLDPVAGRLQRLGMSRAWATALIASVVFSVLIAMILILLPTVIRQLTQMVEGAPALVRSIFSFLDERFPEMMEDGGFIAQTMTDFSERFRQAALQLLGGTVRSVVNIVGLIFVMIVTPTVAIYLLHDWGKLVAAVNRRLPPENATIIRRLAAEIDDVLGGFVKGQIIVGALLATFYSIALMALGLNYALVIGIISGLLNFIPWVGSFSGFFIATGVALLQFWGDWWMVALVSFVFVFGQVFEGNVVTPNIVGDSVKLHPVILMMSLAIGGTLMGFAGLLIAVPVAAALGVVARHYDRRWMTEYVHPASASLPGTEHHDERDV